jgi:hypothetical protein
MSRNSSTKEFFTMYIRTLCTLAALCLCGPALAQTPPEQPKTLAEFCANPRTEEVARECREIEKMRTTLDALLNAVKDLGGTAERLGESFKPPEPSLSQSPGAKDLPSHPRQRR